MLTHDLAKKLIVVVGELAFGIEIIAHKAAIDTSGITIAMLASNVVQISPRSN